MNILIGLIPALLWGSMPITINKAGGRPINQLLGSTYGAFIVGLIIYLLKRPSMSAADFWWCFLSGAAWSFAQITQYTSFNYVGVSTAMPISTGLQLVGNSIIGVLFFGSWQGGIAKLIGFAAIIIIIIGVGLTTKTDEEGVQVSKHNYRLGMTNLLVGTIGYVGFSAFPKIPKTDGWAALFPQTIGMIIAAIVFSVVIKGYRKQRPVFAKKSFANSLTGFIFGLGSFVYLISTQLNGISTGFTISQMCVIVSTLGGIYIVGEHKTKKEFAFTIAGLVLVVIGGIMSGSLQ